MKSLITTLFVFLFSFGFANEAFAHATPITYEPKAGEIIETLPEHVSIHFSERIEENASGISVYGPDGSRVDASKATVDSSDARLYGVDIKDGGEGTYTVSWQVVSSDDGHFTKGAFAFSVGKATGESTSLGQIQIQHITTAPQAVTISIELVGQAMILGVLFFLAFLWRTLKKKFPEDIDLYKDRIENRFKVIFLTGAIFIIAGALLFIVIKTFDLQQLREGDFMTTFKVFLGTVDGSHALLRAFIALFSIPVFLYFRRSILNTERITKGEIGLIFLLCIMLLSRGRVSHAAASHFLPWFSVLINSAQLLFKELWVGGLIVFSVAFVPFLSKLKSNISFAFLSRTLSKFLSLALLGVGVTGAYIVWLHLKGFSYLFSTEWGARFITLSLWGLALLLVRLYHQFIFDRRVMTSRNVVKYSPITFSLEMLVGVALLVSTSFIIITTPPYASEHYTFNKTAVSQDAEVSISVHPFESSLFLIDVTDLKQKETPVSNMVVSITNAEKSIGPIVIATEERFMGGYVFPRALLTPLGNWKIDISAERPLKYDAVGSFTVDYPKEVDMSNIGGDKRSLGLFEIFCLLGALILIGVGYLLYRFSLNNIELLDGRYIEEGTPNIFPSYIPKTISVVGLTLIYFAIMFSYNAFFKTDFQKLCQKNGHFWLQSIPVKDGKALSPNTVTGCFLDVGLYHFGDQREYEFFYKKREIIPELSYSPTKLVAGVPTDITLSLSEIKNGEKAGPATEIGIYHDRILHVLIVGEDLKTFAHIHTEDLGVITEEMKKEAVFPLRYTFPKAGRYVLNIGYVVSGIEYTNVVVLNVAGSKKMQQPEYIVPSESNNASQTKEFDGYEVTFEAPRKVKAGEPLSLKYHIEKDGKPVKNLEPYLGAAMHLGMVRNDLGRFFHTHGEASQPGSVWFQQRLGKYFKYHMHFAPDSFGPDVITSPWSTKFTTKGVYTIFGEFKVENKVIVTDFEVEVE